MKQVNQAKVDFMLQFILNARRAGRSHDLNGGVDRNEIVKAAGDLYDRTIELCTEEVELATEGYTP